MAKIKLAKGEAVDYYPAETWSGYYEVDVTDEEERWLWESYKEWEAAQEFIAGKIAQMEQEKDGK